MIQGHSHTETLIQTWLTDFNKWLWFCEEFWLPSTKHNQVKIWPPVTPESRKLYDKKSSYQIKKRCGYLHTAHSKELKDEVQAYHTDRGQQNLTGQRTLATILRNEHPGQMTIIHNHLWLSATFLSIRKCKLEFLTAEGMARVLKHKHGIRWRVDTGDFFRQYPRGKNINLLC